MHTQHKQSNPQLSHILPQKNNTERQSSVDNGQSNLIKLKKMLSRTKNRGQCTPHEQSLLFDRNSSLTMLKAYNNRRRILIQESAKNRPSGFRRRLNYQPTLGPPEKLQLTLESVKCNFTNNNIRQTYDQLLRKIQHQSLSEITRLPEIKANSIRPVQNFQQNICPDLYQEKDKLPTLKKLSENSPKVENNMASSYQTIEPNQQKLAWKKDFYRTRTIKSSNQNMEGNKILLMKNNLRQSHQHSSILPELSPSKSIQSLCSESNNLRKGYMFFHPEGKSFIRQNRQKLNTQPKIQSLIITGITAQSYAVVDLETMTPIACKNFNKKIQIASISKVMTCYLCLLACKKYEIDLKKYLVRVSREASEMNGTSAGLQIGDCLTLEEALYALMLPSGNDASIAIAQTIGKIIQRHKTKQTKKTYYETFIAHMNMLSRELRLQQQWKNSSGLPSNPNHSTPLAICWLTIVAMMNQKFKEIVSCKEYEITIKNQRSGLKKFFKWKNTNKLLDDGWEGVKTGTTDSAGHCLMAKKDRYLVAVFSSKTMAKRFTDCSQLYQIVKSKQCYLFPQEWK